MDWDLFQSCLNKGRRIFISNIIEFKNRNVCSDGSSEELLKYLADNNIIDLDDVRNSMREEERKRLLAKHKYKIFQEKDGRWRTTLPDETKKNGRRSVAKSTLKKLEDAIIDYYAKQEDEQYIEENTVNTLRKLYAEWISYKQLHTNSTAYIKRIITDWKKFYDKDEIADMELENLTRVYLDEWIHKTIKEYKLTKTAYYNMATILSQSLDYACMDGVDILKKNPMIGIKINSKLFRKVPKPKSDTQVYLVSEQKLIAEECTYKVERNGNCTTPLAILLNFQLGLRIGELVALKWSDIEGNYIHIQRMEVEDYEIIKTDTEVRAVPKGYKVVDYTKSEAGTRPVYLNSEARRLLKLVRIINEKYDYYDDGYIFISSQRQKRSNARTFTTYLEKLCIAIGILNKSNHKIRKTFISSLFDNNVNIDTIRETAGHEDERTSLNNYCFDQSDAKALEEKLEHCKNTITATFQIVS